MTTTLTAPARLTVADSGKRLLAAQISVDPKRLGLGMVEAVTSVFDVEFTEGGMKPRQVTIDKGAFTDVLARKPTAPIMWQHAWQHGPIGQSIEEEETDQGLRMLGELFIDDDPLARRVWKAMLPGSEGGKASLEEWSIGFWIRKESEEERGTDDEPEESLWHLEEIDRAEHSVVLRGANPLTETISVNAAGHAVVAHSDYAPCTMPSAFTVGGRTWSADPGDVDASKLPALITLAGVTYRETTADGAGALGPIATTGELVDGAERLFANPIFRRLFPPGQ